MHCISILVLHIFCVFTTAEIKGKHLVSKMHVSAPPPCGCGYCPSKGGDYICGYLIGCFPCFVIQYFVSLVGLHSSCFVCGSFFSAYCLLCLCGRLFVCAMWSPAGKGLASWHSFVVSDCEFVTFPLVCWVRCGT